MEFPPVHNLNGVELRLLLMGDVNTNLALPLEQPEGCQNVEAFRSPGLIELTWVSDHLSSVLSGADPSREPPVAGLGQQIEPKRALDPGGNPARRAAYPG